MIGFVDFGCGGDGESGSGGSGGVRGGGCDGASQDEEFGEVGPGVDYLERVRRKVWDPKFEAETDGGCYDS